jgi:hypothetical protein
MSWNFNDGSEVFLILGFIHGLGLGLSLAAIRLWRRN